MDMRKSRSFFGRGWMAGVLGLSVAAVLLTGCGGGGLGGGGGSSFNPPAPVRDVWGVTGNNRLIRIDRTTLAITLDQPLSGLNAGETLLAIDFRPSDQQLYGLTSASRLVIIDRATFVATAVNPEPFTPPITGDAAGFDFDPVLDQARVITPAGLNLRIDPDSGATVGTGSALAPAGSYVGFAYTPSVAGQTTAFAIDAQANRLVRVGGVGGDPSADSGAVTSLGFLNVDVSNTLGFDIDDAGSFYVYTSSASGGALLGVNPATGEARAMVTLGAALRGIAVEPVP